MPQSNLWERKTIGSAVLSALIAAAVALSVGAWRGEAVTLHPGHVSGSQSLTDTSTAGCQTTAQGR
jgi:hypothetical protein